MESTHPQHPHNVSVVHVVNEASGAVAEIPIDFTAHLPHTVLKCAARFNRAQEAPVLVLRADGHVLRDRQALAAALRGTNPVASLVLSISPKRSAQSIFAELDLTDENNAKRALLDMQKFVNDQDFATEFFALNGLFRLSQIVSTAKNNMTLSLALMSLHSLLEFYYVPSSPNKNHGKTRGSNTKSFAPFETLFTPSFIPTLLIILQQHPQTILHRPTTSLLIKLLDDPLFSSHLLRAIQDYVNEHPQLIPTLVGRFTTGKDGFAGLGSGVLASTLAFINALINRAMEDGEDNSGGGGHQNAGSSSTAHDSKFLFFDAFEANGLRRALVSVMWGAAASSVSSSPTGAGSSGGGTWNRDLAANAAGTSSEDGPSTAHSEMNEVAKLVVEFQRLLVREWNRRKRIPVVISPGSDHERVLVGIWTSAGLDADSNGSHKWRRLGFDSDTPRKELSRVGFLGLEIIASFTASFAENVSRFMYDQSVKASEKRCPFVKASAEVLEILFDHWEISTGYTTVTTFQPLLLELEHVFAITLRLYFRLWLEMEAQNTGDDVTRVGKTIRSHFRHCVNSTAITDLQGFMAFERDVLSTSYAVIRERQLSELNNDDELLQTRPFRMLREKLYASNYEFIKEQRIGCLIAGSWFPVLKEKGKLKGAVKYYRLNPNRKYLHHGDFREPGSAPSLEQLPHKIEISHITDIITGYFKNPRSPAADISNYGLASSPISPTTTLTFSLVTSIGGPVTTLAQFACTHATQYSEWVDGFNMLLDRSIATQDTAALILQLTQHEMRLGLLGITGNGFVDAVAAATGGESSSGGDHSVGGRDDAAPTDHDDSTVVEVPELPNNLAFFYQDSGAGGLQEGIGGLEALLSELNAKSLEGFDSDNE
ncbi:hypothetical protein HDU84_002382 [Entophlyctis sp. JEL0112]|nr:hypothetical protein HDU84_002382 [Entophlyctis sp. JEL0112]